MIMREIKTGKTNQQRGAVLIIALILLLLLTLVGVAGMRDTELQEKMAGGAEDRAIAFQAAESALKEGEALVFAVSGNCTGACAAAGYYAIPAPPTPNTQTARVDASNNPVSEADYWAKWFGGANAPNWNNPTKVKTYNGVALPNVATQPRYVIEMLPSNYSALPNTTNIPGNVTGTSTIHDFLITARGTGRTDSAVVILQSMYRYSCSLPAVC